MVSQIATGLAEFLTFFYTACVIRKRCRHLTWCCGDTMSGCIEKVSQTTKHQFSLKITALCTNVEDGITKIGNLRRWIRRDFVYPSLNFQAFQFKPANFQKFAKFRYLQDPAQEGSPICCQLKIRAGHDLHCVILHAARCAATNIIIEYICLNKYFNKRIGGTGTYVWCQLPRLK